MAPVLQPAKHDLDTVAALVSTLVLFDGLAAGLPAPDAGPDPLIFKGFAKPIGIVAPVGQQPVGLGQAAQQRCGAGIVADLARSHEELEWAAPGIRDGVQLGIHATYGSPDQSATLPFFNRRLDAVRCAFR
jgi:hypothetical protein